MNVKDDDSNTDVASGDHAGAARINPPLVRNGKNKTGDNQFNTGPFTGSGGSPGHGSGFLTTLLQENFRIFTFF